MSPTTTTRSALTMAVFLVAILITTTTTTTTGVADSSHDLDTSKDTVINGNTVESRITSYSRNLPHMPSTSISTDSSITTSTPVPTVIVDESWDPQEAIEPRDVRSSPGSGTAASTRARLQRTLNQLLDMQLYYRHLLIRNLLSESQIQNLTRMQEMIDNLRSMLASTESNQ